MTTLAPATTPATAATEAPATLIRNAQGNVTSVCLDGTHYPLSVLRRALRHQLALHQIGELLGFEDTRDEAAIVARVRALVDRSGT